MVPIAGPWATAEPPAKAAMRAGADGLVHGVFDAPVDEELIGLLKRNRAFYMSTSIAAEPPVLGVAEWRRVVQDFDDAHRVPAAAYEVLESPALTQQIAALRAAGITWSVLNVARANLRAVHDAGIPIVIGTDSPVPGVLPGITTLLEMQRHVEAGLTPIEAIRAATIDAQRVLGRDTRSGTIEPGKDADLILLYADPLADIRNLRRLKAVVQAGIYVDVPSGR